MPRPVTESRHIDWGLRASETSLLCTFSLSPQYPTDKDTASSQAYRVYHSIGDGPKKRRLHLVISDHGI